MKDIGPDARITVVEKADVNSGDGEGRVLRVVREGLRVDPPVVRFETAPRRYLGFFH